MTTPLNDDKYLSIMLLSFDKVPEARELFYFLEMSTLQATTLLPPNSKITECDIVAYNSDNQFLDKAAVEEFKSIGDFNNFFLNNQDYYIHNCIIELEKGMSITSHDDGEVSIEFTANSSGETLISQIFEKYNLDKKLINELKSKPGHYIAIDKQNNIRADYKSFDEYLENGLR